MVTFFDHARAAALVPLLLVASLAIAPSLAPAQALTWAHQFGSSQKDEAYALDLDSNGNAYMAGVTTGKLPGQDQVANAFGDAFVIKFDSTGAWAWTRQFGTSGIQEGHGVAVDGDGNVLVVGQTSETLSGAEVCGCGDEIFVRKYDPDGNVLWTRQFGWMPSDETLGVVADEAGYVYVVGGTSGWLPGQVGVTGPTVSVDAFVRKYDSDGNEVWTRQFGTPAFDDARAVAVGPAGSVYVAGSTRGGAFPGQTYTGGFDDAFVRKYDANGNEVWTREFGAPGGASDTANTVAVDAGGGVYVGGSTSGLFPGETTVGGYYGIDDGFVRRYDTAGNEEWTRQISLRFFNNAYASAVDAAGNAYVTGFTQGPLTNNPYDPQWVLDAFVTKFDPAGRRAWTRVLGLPIAGYARGIAINGTENPLVAGIVYGNFPGETQAGYGDTFLARLSTPPLIDFGDTCPDSTLLRSGASVNLAVTDEESGVAFQSVPNGKHALDTDSVGPHSFDVTAIDLAGNQAAGSCDYKVLYDFDGFLSRIQLPPVLNRGKSTVAVSWILRDGTEAFAIDPDAVASAEYQSIDCADPVSALGDRTPIPPGPKPALRIKPSKGRYTYKWMVSKTMQKGCYALILTLNDGSEHSADFSFEK